LPSGSVAMSVSKFTALVGATGGHDACALAGVLPNLPNLFNPTGQALTLNVSTVTATFTLDKNGRGKSGQGQIALKFKLVRNKTTHKQEFHGGNVPFTARLQHGAWAAAWNISGN